MLKLVQLNQAELAFPFCWSFMISQLLLLQSRKMLMVSSLSRTVSECFILLKYIATEQWIQTTFFFLIKKKWVFWNSFRFVPVHWCYLSYSCCLFSTCLGLKAAFSSESYFRDGLVNFLLCALSGRFPGCCGQEPGVVIPSFKAWCGLVLNVLPASSEGDFTLWMCTWFWFMAFLELEFY